jgi:hypothetical protein
VDPGLYGCMMHLVAIRVAGDGCCLHASIASGERCKTVVTMSSTWSLHLCTGAAWQPLGTLGCMDTSDEDDAQQQQEPISCVVQI